MSTQQLIQVAVSLFVPILTAVLGVLSLAVGDWRQRRTQAGRRKLALEDAGRQVSFATEWWNARKLLADSPEAEQEATTRAATWLEEASALIAESKPPPVDEKPAITIRRLLLLDPLQRRAARVLRVVFWVCLGLVPIWVGGLMHDIFEPGGVATEYLYGDLVIIAGLVVIAMVLRSWTRRVEEANPEGQKRRRVTLGRALLLYRFDRPAARIVRIIFYIAIFLLVVLGRELVYVARATPHYLPGNLVQFVGYVVYAVALRYWAASLEIRKDRKASPAASSATAVNQAQGEQAS